MPAYIIIILVVFHVVAACMRNEEVGKRNGQTRHSRMEAKQWMGFLGGKGEGDGGRTGWTERFELNVPQCSSVLTQPASQCWSGSTVQLHRV